VPYDSVLFLVSDAWVGLPHFSLLLFWLRVFGVVRLHGAGPSGPSIQEWKCKEFGNI
jgi:hypothetical protein